MSFFSTLRLLLRQSSIILYNFINSKAFGSLKPIRILLSIYIRRAVNPAAAAV